MAAGPSVVAVHTLVVTYALQGATPPEHAELCEQLAPALLAVQGLVSLSWLRNGATARYGSLYVFSTKQACDHFVSSEIFDALRTHAAVADFTSNDFATTPAAARPPAEEAA